MNDEEIKLLTETLKNKDDYIKELKQEILEKNKIIEQLLESSIPKIKIEQRIKEIDKMQRDFDADNSNSTILRCFYEKYGDSSPNKDFNRFNMLEIHTYMHYNLFLELIKELENLLRLESDE